MSFARLPVLHAAILAGGRSSRMGTDKALLLVGGMSMLERISRVALLACPELLIVGRSKAPADWPGDVRATFLADEAAEYSGPIAGLIRALEFTGAPVLLLACDTPLLTAPTIARLLAAHAAAPPGTRATLAVSNDADGSVYAEPTFSVYAPEMLPMLREMLAMNRRSFQPLLGCFGVCTFSIPVECADELLNINDPESLMRVREFLEHKHE